MKRRHDRVQHAHLLTVWDSKPLNKGSPINWVELKTSTEIRGQGDMEAFHRKLMKYWIQSFLLGVPKIIVGFRTRDGILVDIKEIETHTIPETVNSQPNPKWNADMCVNFAAAFLECRLSPASVCSRLLNVEQGLRLQSMMRGFGGYLDNLDHRQSKSTRLRKQGMAISYLKNSKTGGSNWHWALTRSHE